jgi:outer membrane receptor for ferrienterochelin and colicins
MKNHSFNLLSFAVISALSAPVFADDGEDTMVITASGFSQSIRNAPASISVVTRQELEKKPFRSLADAVKDIEGISIIGSGSNASDISIRGLPGDYTLILVDGKRQNSRESRPNGNGGFEAGFIPPLEAIERIEVIRGPMSSLYGSDAMGGVINIITRKADNQWHAAVGLDGTLQENSDSGNIYNGNIYLSAPIVDDLLALQLYGSGNYRAEDKIIGGYNRNDNKSITTKLTYTPTDAQTFIFEAGRAVQKREQTPGKSIDEFTYRGSLKQPNPKTNINNERNHWALTHLGQYDFGFSEISVYQEQTKRTNQSYKPDAAGNWVGGYLARKPEITNSVVDGKITLPLESNTVTIGGQYQHSQLKDDSATGAATTVNKKISTSQRSVFIEDELAITDDLLFTGGVRLDDHQKYGDYWNPRGYLVYSLTDRITLRSGIAKAFKSPSLRDINENYGTITQGGAGIMYGNPDLKPETSVSEEIGLAYDHESGFSAGVTLFNTDFKNKLSSYATGTTDPITGLNLFTFNNVGKANIKGIEFSTGVPVLDNLRWDTNYTYLDSKRKSDDEFFSTGQSLKGQPLAQTPKHSVNSKLNWTIDHDLSAYTRVNYTGKQIWAAQRNSYSGPRYRGGFTTVDVGGSYQLNKQTDINLAVLNLTDKTDEINVKGGNWNVEDGRRYWAGVNVKF